MKLSDAQRRFLESDDRRFVRARTPFERTMWALAKKGAIVVYDQGWTAGRQWYRYEPTEAGRAALAGAK